MQRGNSADQNKQTQTHPHPMKTKLCQSILFLAAVSAISSAQAGEKSVIDRVVEKLQERHTPVRTPTAVAAVRG
jgi:hypothetical protein